MGRSKARAAKKPFAKAPPHSQPISAPPLDLIPSSNDLPSSLIPPSTAVDLNDPNFRTAWQNWTTSALGRLDQLPKLSQSQLDAIAGAAAGIDGSAGNLGIDLPASLAALFEAKLTLDREKAKLVRMQKELKGYKDAAGTTVAGQAVVAAATAAAQAHIHDHHEHNHDHDHHHHDHHDHNSHHGHIHDHGGHSHGTVVTGNGKGKQVMVEEDYGECTCQEHEEYYESEEECYDCDCDCHGCEHDEEVEEEEDPGPPRSTVLDDPERLDEAVRELFNWIKAVVWTIEQAAIVAGKRR